MANWRMACGGRVGASMPRIRTSLGDPSKSVVAAENFRSPRSPSGCGVRRTSRGRSQDIWSRRSLGVPATVVEPGAGLLDRDQDESRLETGDVFGIQAQASLDGAGIGALTVTRTRVQLVRACTIPRGARGSR